MSTYLAGHPDSALSAGVREFSFTYSSNIYDFPSLCHGVKLQSKYKFLFDFAVLRTKQVGIRTPVRHFDVQFLEQINKKLV